METNDKTIGWIARLTIISSQSTEGYLPIRRNNGERAQGGNQGWYHANVDLDALKKHGIKSQWQLCRRDENYRIASLGCGVMAMTDLEIYLQMRFCGGIKGSGKRTEITQSDYESYAKHKWNGTYRIGKSYFNYLTGLYPWKMEEGLRKFLKENRLERQKVKWAPFSFTSQKTRRAKTLELIRNMLEADYPVVCSYHTFQPKTNSLTLYKDFGNAIKGKPPGDDDDTINSHYMTIIGLCSEGDQYLLRVESWGKLFFVRFDEYAGKLNYFTNVLSIL